MYVSEDTDCMNDLDSSGVMTASCTQTLSTMSILTSTNALFTTVLTSTGASNYSIQFNAFSPPMEQLNQSQVFLSLSVPIAQSMWLRQAFL